MDHMATSITFLETLLVLLPQPQQAPLCSPASLVLSVASCIFRGCHNGWFGIFSVAQVFPIITQTSYLQMLPHYCHVSPPWSQIRKVFISAPPNRHMVLLVGKYGG